MKLNGMFSNAIEDYNRALDLCLGRESISSNGSSRPENHTTAKDARLA
jgi:hypothetical protein